MKRNIKRKIIVLVFSLMMFHGFSVSYANNFKLYMVYSSKTKKTRFITYDAEKTSESDDDMYVTFFEGGSDKLAWAAAKMNNIEVITLDQLSQILIKKGCITEVWIDGAMDNIPLRSSN